jgi:DNA polymerase
MSAREEARLVVRYLEREIAGGRASLWEATISASRRAGPSAHPGPAALPVAAPAGLAPSLPDVDLEAESLLYDAPRARSGPGDPPPGDNLLKIAGEARACTKCGLSKGRTQAVPGVGTGSSGIVFVGEAPGAEEDRRGEPFVGRAGELLTKILAAMDERKLLPGVPVSRESVYICNVLKCRPPENRNPLPHEIEACSPYLLRQLAILRPKIICCLGKFAAELLVGAKGTVASMRGKVYRFGSAKLLVTYHPAACLRNPSLKRPVWEDMQRLAEEYASA